MTDQTQKPAWQTLLTEEECQDMVDDLTECVRDDPRVYAEMYLDGMTDREVALDYLASVLADDPTEEQIDEWLRERRAAL